MKHLPAAAPIVLGLLLGTAGCGAPRYLAPWAPGVYHYRSTLPGTGAVAGTIEIGADGPLNVTSSVGECEPRIEPTPRRFRERVDGELMIRSFICGTDHRFTVVLGRDGQPPIEGSISNTRADTLTTYGETTCKEYQNVEVGADRIERVCVAWNIGPKREVRTSGGTARWYLVTDSVAPRP